jgi:hypothetical protein
MHLRRRHLLQGSVGLAALSALSRPASTTGDDPNNTFNQFLVAYGGGGIALLLSGSPQFSALGGT